MEQNHFFIQKVVGWKNMKNKIFINKILADFDKLRKRFRGISDIFEFILFTPMFLIGVVFSIIGWVFSEFFIEILIIFMIFIFFNADNLGLMFKDLSHLEHNITKITNK